MTKKVQKESYLKEINGEMKKVIWPKLKDVLKYTLATVTLCLVLIGFFALLNLLSSFIKGLFI